MGREEIIRDPSRESGRFGAASGRFGSERLVRYRSVNCSPSGTEVADCQTLITRKRKIWSREADVQLHLYA
ncbi:hypothetical protein J6590_065601 [Homalodisca vitripennis]|nr:hypothetical protein J6590_065601 [Homalodisca vitripennis]